MADVSDNYLYTDTDLAELSISLGVIIPTISYAIAREIRNKIPIKRYI